jgi:hypothetical protein
MEDKDKFQDMLAFCLACYYFENMNMTEKTATIQFASQFFEKVVRTKSDDDFAKLQDEAIEFTSTVATIKDRAILEVTNDDRRRLWLTLKEIKAEIEKVDVKMDVLTLTEEPRLVQIVQGEDTSGFIGAK